MLFNSPEFIIFCVVVYGLYWCLPFRLQNYMLLSASYIFYGWWDVRFLFLVALSTTVDFWIGLMIERGRLARRELLGPALFLLASAILFLGINSGAPLFHPGDGTNSFTGLLRTSMILWSSAGVVLFLALLVFLFSILDRAQEETRRFFSLMISLTTQLGLLGVFKYFNFFASSLADALNSIGLESNPLHLDIVLPVGVSFYTFQSLSYTIDTYRRQLKPTTHFFDFALFVAYFPQLQAGPIERARHLLPQLSSARKFNIDNVSRGLYLIAAGFFKKVAIADGVSPIVDQIFGSTGRITWIDVLVGTTLFAVQIYCDFSGYTDIARGISKLFGINLIVNFNLPYFSTNPQEFWHRWHISLSTWLRDYVYIPLGGSRGNLAFVCRNLMITMVLGGLWHGAAWNFVLWGLYQGGALCAYRIWNERKFQKPSIGTRLNERKSTGPLVPMLSRAAILAAILYGWLLFRSHSLEQIESFTSLLISDFGDLDYGGNIPRFSALVGIPVLAAMEIGHYLTEDPCFYRRLPVPIQGFLIALLIAITIMGMSNEPAQFIYFQF